MHGFCNEATGCNNSRIALTTSRDKSVVIRGLKHSRDRRNGRYNAGFAQRKFECWKREKPSRIRFAEAVRKACRGLAERRLQPGTGGRAVQAGGRGVCRS